MSTALTPERKTPTEMAKLSGDDSRKMVEIDNMLKEFHRALADPAIGDIQRMMLQAKGIAVLDQAITDEMMKDVMWLMNTPLGFKTDRSKSPFYDAKDVKRCLIQAWLFGAKAVGNEFNIIAGNCYLTKEFCLPAILRWPGIRDFAIEISPAVSNGDHPVAVSAKATWTLNGEEHSLDCVKTDDFDGRIIVKSYPSSSPDELRGKCEAKLYKRVLQRLTGLNYGEGDDFDPSKTVDALSRKEVPVVLTDSEKELVAEAVSGDATIIGDEKAAAFMVSNFAKDISENKSINETNSWAKKTTDLIESQADWSTDLIEKTKLAVADAAAVKVAEIRASRSGCRD